MLRSGNASPSSAVLLLSEATDSTPAQKASRLSRNTTTAPSPGLVVFPQHSIPLEHERPPSSPVLSALSLAWWLAGWSCVAVSEDIETLAKWCSANLCQLSEMDLPKVATRKRVRSDKRDHGWIWWGSKVKALEPTSFLDPPPQGNEPRTGLYVYVLLRSCPDDEDAEEEEWGHRGDSSAAPPPRVPPSPGGPLLVFRLPPTAPIAGRLEPHQRSTSPRSPLRHGLRRPAPLTVADSSETRQRQPPIPPCAPRPFSTAAAAVLWTPWAHPEPIQAVEDAHCSPTRLALPHYPVGRRMTRVALQALLSRPGSTPSSSFAAPPLPMVLEVRVPPLVSSLGLLGSPVALALTAASPVRGAPATLLSNASECRTKRHRLEDGSLSADTSGGELTPATPRGKRPHCREGWTPDEKGKEAGDFHAERSSEDLEPLLPSLLTPQQDCEGSTWLAPTPGEMGPTFSPLFSRVALHELLHLQSPTSDKEEDRLLVSKAEEECVASTPAREAESESECEPARVVEPLLGKKEWTPAVTGSPSVMNRMEGQHNQQDPGTKATGNGTAPPRAHASVRCGVTPCTVSHELGAAAYWKQVLSVSSTLTSAVILPSSNSASVGSLYEILHEEGNSANGTASTSCVSSMDALVHCRCLQKQWRDRTLRRGQARSFTSERPDEAVGNASTELLSRSIISEWSDAGPLQVPSQPARGEKDSRSGLFPLAVLHTRIIRDEIRETMLQEVREAVKALVVQRQKEDEPERNVMASPPSCLSLLNTSGSSAAERLSSLPVADVLYAGVMVEMEAEAEEHRYLSWALSGSSPSSLRCRGDATPLRTEGPVVFPSVPPKAFATLGGTLEAWRKRLEPPCVETGLPLPRTPPPPVPRRPSGVALEVRPERVAVLQDVPSRAEVVLVKAATGPFPVELRSNPEGDLVSYTHRRHLTRDMKAQIDSGYDLHAGQEEWKRASHLPSAKRTAKGHWENALPSTTAPQGTSLSSGLETQRDIPCIPMPEIEWYYT